MTSPDALMSGDLALKFPHLNSMLNKGSDPIDPVSVLKSLLGYYIGPDYMPSSGILLTDAEEDLRNRLRKVIDDQLFHSGIAEHVPGTAGSYAGDLLGEGEEDSCSLQSVEDADEISEPEEEEYIPSQDDLNESNGVESYHGNSEVEMDYKRKAVAFWRSGSTKNSRSLSSVKSKFKRVPSVRALQLWENQVKNGGTKNDKLRRINEPVLARYEAAQQDGINVHEKDLKGWAMEAQEIVQLNRFTASSKWTSTFKRASGIRCTRYPKTVNSATGISANEVCEL